MALATETVGGDIHRCTDTHRAPDEDGHETFLESLGFVQFGEASGCVQRDRPMDVDCVSIGPLGPGWVCTPCQGHGTNGRSFEINNSTDVCEMEEAA